MSNRKDIDRAISNVMQWIAGSEWQKEQAAIFDAHIVPLCDRFEIDNAELIEELTEHGYGDMVFGILFEDFLSRRLPPDGRNVIDEYLKRRGWRESVPGRRYLQQLRDSVLSLYEVIEVSPGHHCDLRDLVRGGDTLRVHENMGTRHMVKWDRIAARILKTSDKHIFSGGILPFPGETPRDLLRVLDHSRKKMKKALKRLAGKEGVDKVLPLEDLDEMMLQESCPAFTSIWIMYTLERLHAPLPVMTNRDGEPLMFAEVRFPFLARHATEITQRLDAAPEWERDNIDENFWTWLPAPAKSDDKTTPAVFRTTPEDGFRPTNGSLELQAGGLRLETNSAERAELGKKSLQALLQGLIGKAHSKLQTAEQLMAEKESGRQSGAKQNSQSPIDPEIAAEVIKTTLDQHYRKCLDEPIPALDGKTPRQCTKTKKGTEKVIEWLKLLENNELRRAAREGLAPYDSRWMWDELKLTRDGG